jgi:hypothetical protein
MEWTIFEVIVWIILVVFGIAGWADILGLSKRKRD